MQEQNPNLVLTLTLNDLNVVLQALAQRPFAEVHVLMGHISTQAKDQIEADKAGE